MILQRCTSSPFNRNLEFISGSPNNPIGILCELVCCYMHTCTRYRSRKVDHKENRQILLPPPTSSFYAVMSCRAYHWGWNGRTHSSYTEEECSNPIIPIDFVALTFLSYPIHNSLASIFLLDGRSHIISRQHLIKQEWHIKCRQKDGTIKRFQSDGRGDKIPISRIVTSASDK